MQSDLKIINCQSTVTNSGDQQRKSMSAIPKAALTSCFMSRQAGKGKLLIERQSIMARFFWSSAVGRAGQVG